MVPTAERVAINHFERISSASHSLLSSILISCESDLRHIAIVVFIGAPFTCERELYNDDPIFRCVNCKRVNESVTFSGLPAKWGTPKISSRVDKITYQKSLQTCRDSF